MYNHICALNSLCDSRLVTLYFFVVENFVGRTLLLVERCQNVINLLLLSDKQTLETLDSPVEQLSMNA